jgi:hypothetical protein
MVIFLSFFLACVLSAWPGNFLIRKIYDLILGSVKGPTKGTMKKWLEDLAPDKDLDEFRSKTAALIGSLERVIFIYALMFAQPNLITGVLILKAFFSWTEHRMTADQSADKSRMLETIAHYHTYVIGNFLSVLTAILLYQLAVSWFPTAIAALLSRLT